VVTFHIPSRLGESACERMRESLFLSPSLEGRGLRGGWSRF